ncbi:MAG: DUF4190 domain-containing protein [Nitrosarchaeum sp.]|nr:DUF4190 domain-containing protein [Nitrosarchaeum sp.]
MTPRRISDADLPAESKEIVDGPRVKVVAKGASGDAGSASAQASSPPHEGKGLAIAALVCSVLFFFPLVPFVGVILGSVVLAKSKPGRGFAIAAIVVGLVVILLQVLLFVVLLSLTMLVSDDLVQVVELSRMDAASALDACLERPPFGAGEASGESSANIVCLGIALGGKTPQERQGVSCDRFSGQDAILCTAMVNGDASLCSGAQDVALCEDMVRALAENEGLVLEP